MNSSLLISKLWRNLLRTWLRTPTCGDVRGSKVNLHWLLTHALNWKPYLDGQLKAVLRRTVRWLFVAACWLRVRVTVRLRFGLALGPENALYDFFFSSFFPLWFISACGEQSPLVRPTGYFRIFNRWRNRMELDQRSGSPLKYTRRRAPASR